MSARFPLPLFLLRHCLSTFAQAFAASANAVNADAAARHGRDVPAPVDVTKFGPKPLPFSITEGGSVVFDCFTGDGLTIASGANPDDPKNRDALILAAARHIATAAKLLEMAGEQ